MVLDFWNRNSSLTLATSLVCGIGQSQRISLLRKTKQEKKVHTWPRGGVGGEVWKVLMGAFVSLKHMLVFLLFTNRLGSVFFQWRALAQWTWNAWQSRSSIVSLPKIEMHYAMRRGLFCSELSRISSISIMPTKLSKERFMEELSTVTVI